MGDVNSYTSPFFYDLFNLSRYLSNKIIYLTDI